MTGAQDSAKRLSRDLRKFAALRHNSIRLLRRRKHKARQSGGLAGRRQMRRFDLALTRDLVEEIDCAAGEHTEQSNTHCHCEIHDASGNLPARQQD
ncbi:MULTISPECIES: hypothetical protein [Paraburkholderia]|uniref:hypothetical protein n=1 Tax=Paraburkholderia TaxID=1822464 RepID=UPI002254F5B6|nr:MULTISPECIES: hypothetical protein [Paraburkholderia]